MSYVFRDLKVNTPTYTFPFADEIVGQDSEFLWRAQILILFLLTCHLNRLLVSALIHSWRILKEQKVYRKQNLKKLSLTTKKILTLFLMESSITKSMESLWVHLQVRHWLMLFLYTFKRIGYKTDHLTLSFITTGGMFMLSLFCQSHQNHLESFRNFLNGRHAIMSFTIENETQNRMSFLNAQITCEEKIFITSVYRKATFSGVYTHFDSLLPSAHTFDTVQTPTYRCFRICSSWTKLHSELVFLRQIS